MKHKYFNLFLQKGSLLMMMLSFSLNSIAQPQNKRCGFDDIRNQMLETQPEYKAINQEMESQISAYVMKHLHEKKERGTVYHIPVVVHVVHNGESIGTGANISVAQINSQIAILNKDYRLLNSDSLQPTHPFWPYTDDCEIEFCLATIDPQGNPTSGIDRINGGVSSYTQADFDANVKPSTIWNRNKYLNIWVATFGGTSSDLLGYATPPGGSAQYDGVVIRTTSFGNTGNVVAPYNKGRTATHEIGHFFDLLHIWGLTFCGDDLVSDTPPAETDNGGCPSFPHNANNACGSGQYGEMYMNYMDYVDDNCMKMFTNGQKLRMRATLANGGPRNSLTTSNACSGTIGLKEINNQPSVSIFPNPCIDHFYICNTADFSSDISFRIFNSFGQEFSSGIILNKDQPNRFLFDTSHLPSGIYSINISSKTTNTTKTVSIIR